MRYAAAHFTSISGSPLFSLFCGVTVAVVSPGEVPCSLPHLSSIHKSVQNRTTMVRKLCPSHVVRVLERFLMLSLVVYLCERVFANAAVHVCPCVLDGSIAD